MNKLASKRPTVADVARAAGVSAMTVSRALNNKAGVGDELRHQISARAAEMGYQPSHIARSLATRQSITVGLIVPDIADPFFAQIARGVEDVAYETGYCVFLANTAENAERETVAFDSLWRKEVEGAILCSSRVRARVLRQQVQRFPAVVLVDRDLEGPIPKTVTINVDDQRGAQTAVQEFLHNKRSKIAFIAGPSNSIAGRHRLEGYRAGLEEAGLAFDARLVENCAPTIEGGQSAAATLLERRPRIDAFLAFNDLSGVGAMQACHIAGRVVPDDVAVIGADDLYLAGQALPRLTTLHVDMQHVGRLAMRSLLDIIQVGTSSAVFRIEPELVRRRISLMPRCGPGPLDLQRANHPVPKGLPLFFSVPFAPGEHPGHDQKSSATCRFGSLQSPTFLHIMSSDHDTANVMSAQAAIRRPKSAVATRNKPVGCRRDEQRVPAGTRRWRWV